MKTKLPQHRIMCPIPLINPSTFLTASAWCNTFEFILNMLRINTRSKELNRNIEVIFRDFYFAKTTDADFNFSKAISKMRKFGVVKYETRENHDRNDEADITVFGNGLKFRLYEFHSLICCSLGPYVRTDGFLVKKKEFQHDPIVWKTTMDTFVEFAHLIERTFMQSGEAWVARCFLKVKCAHATVVVEVFYERLPTEELHLKRNIQDIDMQKILGDIGAVPQPRCWIKFK